MKRKFLCMTLGLMMVLNGRAYAESLDTTYLDYLWNKLSDKSATEKQHYGEQLKVLMASDASLESSKIIYKNYLNEAQMSELAATGLTDDKVVQNLDKLKTWSPNERNQLIGYVVSGDKAALLALNASKQAGATTTPSNGGSGGNSSGGGTVTAPSTNGVANNTTAQPTVITPTAGNKELVQAKQTSLAKAADMKKEVAPSKQVYSDLMTHWSKDYATYFVDRGIVSGKSAGKLMPDAVISQAEIVTILMKTFYTQPNATINEKDAITKLTWYESYYTSGKNQSWFTEAFKQVTPNEQMNRGEVLRTLSILGKELGISNAEAYLVQGDQNGNKNLTQKVTRAEFLTMLYKLVERYE